jgi:hypothetical protein
MGALIKACQKSLSIKNTGAECDESMGPTAMLFAIPPGLTWQASDLEDFFTYLNTKIHAPLGQRVYPLFGPDVPIRKITMNKESDVIPVQDDGTPIFVRYGMITRMLGTTGGGLCYAQVLQSLLRAGYGIVEVDNANQVLMRANEDGTYGGLKTTFMYSPSPDLADLKNPAYTYFQFTFDPREYVGFGEIFQADSDITDLTGLLDVELTDATGSSATKLKIGVETICANTDLVALLGSPLAAVAIFVVTKQSDGTPVTISAAAIVSGHIELTGTFTSATAYVVALADVATLFTNGIEGYEGTKSVVITIP